MYKTTTKRHNCSELGFPSNCSTSISLCLCKILIKELHLLKKSDLNDLVRNSDDQDRRLQLLESRLKQTNPNTRVSQEYFVGYFTKEYDLVIYNNAEGLLQELGFPESLEDWRLIIYSLKKQLESCFTS